jgi:hypothetical protein
MEHPNETAPPSRDSGGWYIRVGDRQFGPLALDRLAEFAANGRLQRGDLVRRSGTGAWVAAEQIAGLFPPARPRGQAVAPAPLSRPGADRAGDAAASRDEARSSPREAGGPARPGPRSAARSDNYFARHWRGELSLPVSYWVNGVLGNIVVAIAVFISAVLMTATTFTTFDADHGTALSILLLICLLVAVVALWQLVGLWRSATRYRDAHPTRYWGGVAKVAVILTVAGAVCQFVAFTIGFFPNRHPAPPSWPGSALPFLPGSQ